VRYERAAEKVREKSMAADSRAAVLAIGAHPDDLEIICGGTLALFVQKGFRVCLCHLTNGEKGGFGQSIAEIRKKRRAEAIASANVIGAESLCGDIPDSEVIVSLENRSLVIDLIRSVAPELVITHSPVDYHADHAAVSKLVFEASYLVTIPHYRTQHEAMRKLPRLFYMDTVAGIAFEPKEYVDITSVIELKRRMMRAHESQLRFVQDLSGIDFLDMIEVTGRYRGYQCNARYAEGFAEHFAWPRTSTTRILPEP
jgi:LmbE family N-acetylglucosaminyl deacetylase